MASTTSFSSIVPCSYSPPSAAAAPTSAWLLSLSTVASRSFSALRRDMTSFAAVSKPAACFPNGFHPSLIVLICKWLSRGA